MERLASWLELPINLLMWLACFIGLLMMLHVSADVVARVVFLSPLNGTIEIVSGYYMVAVAFLPLAYITRHEGQIVVELFTRNMGQRRILRLDAAMNLLTFLYMCVFAWMTAAMAIEQSESREAWETAYGQIEVWPSRWYLPVASLCMALYLLVRAAADLKKARNS